MCVLLIGCLNDKQSGADNFTESTATNSRSQTTITTSILPMTSTPTATKPLTETVALLPTLISTPQASPVPTSTPLPSLVWSESVERVANIREVDSDSIVWSPVVNEFIVHNCWSALNNEIGQQSIFYAVAPDFSPVKITSDGFICVEPLLDMIWSTDGAHILFAGPFPEDHPFHPLNSGWDNSAIWIMDHHGDDSHPINLDQAYGRYMDFIDWMDEQTLVYEAYAGGGHHYTAMLDVSIGEPISWAVVHIGGGYQPGLDYIGTNTGMTFDGYISAMAVSKTMVNPDTIFDGGPFSFCVSKFCNGNPPDKPPLLESSSRFEDWLPDTNKMLLLTWAAGDYLTDFDEESLTSRLDPAVETQLQLWDVDAHEVFMLVPQGIYGRFSGDGQYLAFHTFTVDTIGGEPNAQIHILHLADEQIILTLPSAAPVIDYRNQPVFVWSPTSDRMIYQDEQGNWKIIQVPSGSQTSITLNGGGRLSFPQWSSNGQYLSVTVRSETEGGIAILRVP